MLTPLRHRLPLRDQRGFTLVETLVAMVTGIIVTGALFAILEFSMHQSGRLTEVAQATQLGRTAMNRIVDELHSGCLSVKFAPVREGSGENKLILIDGYGENAEVPATAVKTETKGIEGVRRDEIEFNEAKGTLTDAGTLGSGLEANGEYAFAGTKTTVQLGEKVAKAEAEKKAVPVFRYYKYNTAAATSTEAASTTLKQIELKSGETLKANAKEVAAVDVSFNIAPNDTNTSQKTGRSVDLNDQSTFAFSAPNSESTIVAGPCE